MKTKEQTVPIYARLPQSDVALIDKAAKEEKESRSAMVARVIREWAKRYAEGNK